MKITEILLDCEDHFLDGDFVSMENYLLINSNQQVIRNGGFLKVKGEISLQYPRVKIISSEKFILVEGEGISNHKENKPNAWIISNDGTIEHSFFIGAINKLITTNRFIIASYHDSAMGLGQEYANNQIVVFDHSGLKLFGYRENDDEKKKVAFQQNYAFFKENEKCIYFLPYPGFSIVKFNLLDFTSQTIFELPKDQSAIPNAFWNPVAFSKRGENWYFLTSDSESLVSRLFRVDSNMLIEEMGDFHFSTNPKGLKDGRFFIPFELGNTVKKRCKIVEV